VEPLPDGSGFMGRKKDWPDLFFLDIDMPVIDGLAICKYLKLNNATKDIPVIMISAYHKLKSKAQAAGVDDFIEKPFEVKNLLQVIGKYIDLGPKSTIPSP
jgi:CheY-like chemotaxis protein